MGDYNVQIVTAGIEKRDTNELENEIFERLTLCDSAYHATAPVLGINNSWDHRTTITLVTQAKYNRGVEEFLDWLEPMVISGIGENDTWAINYSEYSGEPTVRKLNNS